MAPTNRGLANWLKAWRSGRAPTMEIFWNNSQPDHRPGIAFFRVVKNTSIHCIAAGAYYKHVLGFNIADRDILEMVNHDDADGRLLSAWQIVEGAAITSDHIFERLGGKPVKAQGICLPLMDESPDGSRYYLLHTGWRPMREDMLMNSVRSDFTGDQGRVVEIFAPTETAAADNRLVKA